MSVDKVAEINAFWLGESMESPAFAAARRDWWYRGGPAVIAKSAGVSEIKSRMPVKENTKIGSRARMATSL